MKEVVMSRLQNLRHELELEFIRNPQENFLSPEIGVSTINIIATTSAAIAMHVIFKAARK